MRTGWSNPLCRVDDRTLHYTMEHFNIFKNDEECDREALLEMATAALDRAVLARNAAKCLQRELRKGNIGNAAVLHLQLADSAQQLYDVLIQYGKDAKDAGAAQAEGDA
jgi:hypothetical protein